MVYAGLFSFKFSFANYWLVHILCFFNIHAFAGSLTLLSSNVKFIDYVDLLVCYQDSTSISFHALMLLNLCQCYCQVFPCRFKKEIVIKQSFVRYTSCVKRSEKPLGCTYYLHFFLTGRYGKMTAWLLANLLPA